MPQIITVAAIMPTRPHKPTVKIDVAKIKPRSSGIFMKIGTPAYNRYTVYETAAITTNTSSHKIGINPTTPDKNIGVEVKVVNNKHRSKLASAPNVRSIQ